MAKKLIVEEYVAEDTILSILNGIYEAIAVTIESENVIADEDGKKIVPAGTVWPSNDEDAFGLTYKTVDVTDGDKEVAVVYSATINSNRLPDEIDEDAFAALRNITFYPPLDFDDGGNSGG